MALTSEMIELAIQEIEEDAMREIKEWRNCYFTKSGKAYYGVTTWLSEISAKQHAINHIEYAKSITNGRLSVMYKNIIYPELVPVIYLNAGKGSGIETCILSHFIPLPIKSKT